MEELSSPQIEESTEEPLPEPSKEPSTDPSAESPASEQTQTDEGDKDQEHFCCSFCKEKFTAIEELLSHIRIHTGGVDSEEDQDEAPQKMKRLSVRLPLLKAARLSSLDSNDGDGQSVSVDEFERTDATPGYQCPTCKRRFSRIIHQLNHKCEHIQVESRLDAINSSLKLFKCVICKEEFGTRQEKLDHKCLPQVSQNEKEEEVPNSAGDDEPDMGNNQEGDYESEEDDTPAAVGDAAQTVSLKLTVRAPTKKGFGRSRRRKSKANHRCNICHRSFTRAWNLKVHNQKTHPPGSPILPKVSPVKSPVRASPRASPRPAHRTPDRASPRPAHRTPDSIKTPADMIPSNSEGPFDFDFIPSYSEKNMVLRRVPSSNAYECPLCGRTMERREAMLSHIRDHRGETPYHCSHCDFKCTHSAKIIKHLAQTHRIPQPNNPPLFEAMKIQAQDSDWQPRKEPYRNFYKIVRSEKERMYKPKKVPETGGFACPICHKSYARFGVAQVHIRIHTGEAPFRCLLCEYQGKQQSLVLAHLEHNHKDIITNSNSHRDEEVDAEFAMDDGDEDVDEEEWENSIDYEEGMVRDKQEEMGSAWQENDSESAQSSENQQAPADVPPVSDGYDFKFRPTQNEMDRVLFRSSLTKMFLCYLCPKEVKEKEIMLAHIRTHTGDKAYFCNYCDFGSAHDAALRKHLVNVHHIKHAKRAENHVETNIRLTTKRPPSKPVMITRTKESESPKTSSKVKKSTPQKSTQVSHKAPAIDKVQLEKKQHKSKKEPAPKQPKSGPSYKDFYIVEKSEKEEECKPQRNEVTGLYKCHFCKLESYSYKTVVIHTRTHTGEKPYNCRLCTFSGSQSSHVIRHLKNTHRVSLDDDGQSDDADDEPPELKREDEQEQESQEEEEGHHEEEEEKEKEELDKENDAELNFSDDADMVDNVEDDLDLAPVDYFAPSVPEEPLDIPPPKLAYKDESSQDETVEEGSQEGGDNDPDWETWMDRSTLNTEVMSAYKGKGKGKLTSPKSAKVNYVFAPSDSEKQLNLKRGADKQFECPTCSKKMREMEIILAHVRTHTGEKPYACCHCNFESAHIASIRKHVMRVHNVKRPVAGSDHKTPLATPGRVQMTPEPKKKIVPRPAAPMSVSRESPGKVGDSEELGADMEERPYSEGISDGYINKFFQVSKRERDKMREKKYIPTRNPETGRAQCRICKGTFSSYGKAVVHIRCHTGEKPYECLLCDYKSSQNPNMKRHIRNQHKEVLYGNVDPSQVKRKETANADAEDNDGADDDFAEAPAVDDYGDDDHDLSGPSMVQRTDFLSQATLADQHANRKGRPDYLYEPTERMKNFEPKRCSSTGMFECTFCSMQFYGIKKIETHVLKHTGEKPYLCMHCDFKSAYSFVMYRHLLNRHQIQIPNHPGSANDNLDETKESEHQDLDSSSFSEGQENDSAYTTTKPETSEALPNSAVATTSYPEGEFDFVFRPTDFELGQVVESTGEGRYKCQHCKKLMSNRKKMVTHIRTHTGEKPFHCCHCDFKTAYKFVIQTHMKGIHKILEPKGDDELIEAQRVRESAKSAFSGDNEGKLDPPKIVIKQEPLDESEMVSDKDGFNEMVANMSAGLPESTNDDASSMEDDALSDYSIQKEGQKPDCVFKPTDVEKNRKLYRPSPGGPSQCPFCSRWLVGLENMRAHVRGHTGEKPYLCCHCDQQSAHFAAIKRHLIKVHKLMRPVMPGDAAPLKKPKVEQDSQKRPSLVVKFKNISFPSSPLKPTQTKFKTQMSKSAASRAKSLAPFTSRDRSLTHFYRNFYTVTKRDEMKKFTPKKDPVTKLFHCNFCEKQFNYHTEAQVHTRTHTGEKPYACLVCEYKGSQWTNIIRHITCVHKKVLEARQREEGIGNLPPEESTSSSGNDQPLDMSRSPHQVTSPRLDTTDKYDSQSKAVDLFTRQGALPTSSQVEADFVFRPSEEEKKRTILPSMKTGLYSCLYCKKKVPNLGKIVTHIRTHTGEKPFICCHCNFKSAYKFVMTQHLSGRHSIKKPKTLQNEDDDDTGPGLEDCPQDMQMKSIATVPSPPPGSGSANDFRFQPSEQEQMMELARRAKTGCFECPYCGRQFSSSETMKAHIRGHTGDKAYYCNHCTFASAHIKSIRNHIQKVHSIMHPRRTGDDRPPRTPSVHVAQPAQQPALKVVPASEIPREIYLKYVLVNKMGPKKFPPRRNPRTGRFKCHFCTMESKQLYTVEIHTMRHTGERPYHCKLCDYKATRQWLVTQHLQTNHKHILASKEGLTLIPKETMNPPAPTAVKLKQSATSADSISVYRNPKTGGYYCSECRKEFMTPTQCREHISTHSGDKLYQCPFCDHRSAHGGAMRNHMKIQHGNDSDKLKKWYTYTMGKTTLQHAFQRDHEGMYMCTYCNKKSSSLNSARRHLCVHTGEKPYSCKLCSFKAIHNISIRLHVTGHHKQITKAFSQGGPEAEASQSGLKNVAEETMKDLGDEDAGEDEWEDANETVEDDKLVSDEPLAVTEDGNMGGMEDSSHHASSPLPAVAPVGTVSVQDADFLYVPSDVDKNVMLQRSRDSQMYECPMCSKQMTNTRTMRAHIRLHKGEKAYHCCHCDYKSAHYSVLRKHVVQVHKIQRPRMAQENDEQDIPFVPPHESPMKVAARERRLAEEQEPASLDDLHLENPNNIPTNMNPDSDRGFMFDANKDEKQSWQELQTTGTCQCPQCGKQCSSPIRTLQHMRTHSGAKPYYCKYCSFRSAYDTSMRNHVRSMHEAGGARATAGSSLKSTGSEIQALQSSIEDDSELAEMEALGKRSSGRSEVRIKQEPADNGYENKSSDVDSDAPPEMAWTFNEEDQSATLVPHFFASPIIEEDHSGPPSLHPESSPSSEDHMSYPEIRENMPSIRQKFKSVLSLPPVVPQFPAGDFTFTPSQQEKDRVMVKSPTTGQCKCPYCPQELTSFDKIKAHIRKHTGDRPYQCLHCKFSSAYRFVIRTHIKNLHKIPVPKQDKSGYTTPQLIPPQVEEKSKVQSHHGGLFKPVLVDEKRTAPKRMLAAGKVSWDEHYKYVPSDAEKKIVLHRSSSTGKFQCPDCSKVLNTIDVMRSHIRTHTGEKPYYCSHCYFRSAHYDSMRKHLIVIHKLKHEGPDQVVDPPEENLDTLKEWQQSNVAPKLQSPIPPTASRGPDFTFKPSDYEKRVRLKQDPSSGLLQCPQCHKQYRSSDGVVAHLRSHTGDKPYRCNHCEYTCPHLSAIKLHLYIVHNIMQPVRPDAFIAKSPTANKSSPDKEDKCEIDKYRHLYVVTKESKKDRKGQTFKRNPVTRAYQCNYCPKESKHHYVIQIHMRMHTGEKPYQCRLCDYQGAQQSRILFHLKGKHADYLKADGIDGDEPSPAVDDMENVSTGDVSMGDVSTGDEEVPLNQHQHEENGESSTEHYVPKLGVDFTMDRNEAEEIIQERLQQSRNYSCPTCGKRCANAVRTIEHMRQHTGAKPYACMRCSTRSAYDRAMRNHVLLQHGRNAKEKEKLYTFHIGRIERSLQVRRDPRTDRFICPFCNKTFRDVNLARSHVRMHTGELPYKCKLCKFRGANTRAIQVHIERLHGNRVSGGSMPSIAPPLGEILRNRLKMTNDDSPVSEGSTNESAWGDFTSKSDQVAVDKPYEGPKLGVDFTCDKIETDNMYCIDPETGGYKCLYCDRVLKTRLVSKIQTHLLCHTGAKPFKCVQCDFRSAHDGSMRSHVLSQHRMISRDYEKLYKFKVGKIERSLRLDQEPGGAYVCPYCPKRCKDLYVAKKHIRSHTGEKPYRCRKCSYMASVKWSVILHAQRQHKIKKSKSKSKRDRKKAGVGNDTELPTTDKNEEGQVVVSSESPDTRNSTETSSIAEDNSEKGMDYDVANDTTAKEATKVGSVTACKVDGMEVDQSEKMEKDAESEKTEKDVDNNRVSVIKKTAESSVVEADNNNEIDNNNENRDESVGNMDVAETEGGTLASKSGVGRLEIDGAPDIKVVGKDEESSASAQPSQNTDDDDVAGKLEIDSGTDESGKPADVDLKKKKVDEDISKDQEVTDTDEKLVSKMEESELKQIAESSKNGEVGEKLSTEDDSVHQENDQSETSDVEEKDIPKVLKILDEANQEMTQQKRNAPDYLFLPSKEEKNLSKSNATGSFECPHCSKHFSDIVVMQTHVRNHTGDTPYHCTHCSFKSVRFPEIRQHLLFDHKIHRPKTLQRSKPVLQKKVICTPSVVDMYRSFFTFVQPKSSYKPKRNSSTGLYECPDCGNTSKRTNGAKVHYRTHTGEKPYHCLLCSYKGAQQSRVVTHIKYNHQDVMKIHMAKESEKAKPFEEMDNFEEDFDMNDDDDESSLVIDEIGVNEDRGVKRKKEVDAPVRQVHEPMWKKGYDYRPSEAENEMILEQDSDGSFMCPICPHKHKLKNVVRNHIRKHTGEKPYYCCHCDFTTANFSSMRTHLIQAHKSMPNKPDMPPSLEREIIAKRAKLEEEFEEEKLAIEEEAPTEGYTFTRSMLEKSLRLQRTVSGKYQCPYCAYEYGALAIVMAHVRTHTGDKPFQCNYCPYSAADYSAMRKHLIKKHDKWHKAISNSAFYQQPPERPPVLAREVPPKPVKIGHRSEGQSEGLHYTFKWGDAEKGLSFHKSEAGVYECPYCPHAHKKKSVVRAHVRKHTGEKPYLCKHCTFMCANFSWMREHLIKRHNMKPEELSKKFKEPKKSKKRKSDKLNFDPPQKAAFSPPQRATFSPPQKATFNPPQKATFNPPQKAPKCDFLFAPSDTEKHVELSKTNTGSYACVFCKKELRIIANMRAHIRGHIGDKPYYCTRCPFRSAHISALRRHLFSMHRIRNAKGQKSTQKSALAMLNFPRSPSRAQSELVIPVVQPLKSSIEPTSSPIIHNILTAPRHTEPTPFEASRQHAIPRTNQYSGKMKGPKYTYEKSATEIALLKSLQASNTLQCPHCSHKFSSISRTMEHVRKHTGAKPFRCLICNFKSAYEGCISRHVSLKHELSAQQLAQFFTFKIGDVEKNADLQKNPETGHYHCPFCEKSWPESAKVKRHMCIHTGEKPYRCNLCGFGAVDKSSMVHHLEMSHKKKITELKDQLDQIMEEEEEGPPSMVPIYQNQSPSMRDGSAFTVEAKESTKLVLRRVQESRRQESHRSSTYHQEQPSPTLLNVPVPSPANSDASDTSGYDYVPSQAEKELLRKLNIEGKIRCQYCGKSCHSAARTLEHIRMHSGEKPYSCKYCKFASAYEGVMKKHVMVRHGKGTGLSVLYSFVAGKILKSIEFEREEDTGRYKCPFCRKTTTSLTGAKRHVCIHTGEKPYKCKLCSYAANERSTILWHIDRQHQDAGDHLPDMPSEHPHNVQHSQHGHQQQPRHGRVDHRKAAVTHALGLAPTHTEKSSVSTNRRGHVDFNPSNDSQLKKVHIEHGDTETIATLFYFEPGKIERSLNLQRDPDNGRYLCPFCEQTSRDLTNAKNHVRVHIGEKPFKCKLCDYASVQRSLVIAHIEKHHIIFPDAEYNVQDAVIGRRAKSSHRRSFPSRTNASGYSNRPAAAASAVPYTAQAPRLQVDDMPLDLSKPLDLSGSSTKHSEPEFTAVVERHHYGDPEDDFAMDLSGGARGHETQESSLDDEEAAYLDADMDDEMMADGDIDTQEDDDFIADDDDRLLEEEMLAAEVGDEDRDFVAKHHEAVLSEARPHRPVSLVKPLNPNEVNEDYDSSDDQGKGGHDVTVGAVVSDGGNPGVSRAKIDERNIWDMAFNWSSGKKPDGSDGEDLEKPPARRSLEYADLVDEVPGRPLDMEDDEDIDVDGVESEEAGILGRLLQKDRVQREDGGVLDHLQAASHDPISVDPSVAMETDVNMSQAIPDNEHAASITSPIHDDVTPESPSTSTWQTIQESTPIKSPVSAALTPERDGADDQGLQDELLSPSSGGLPVITNVMSLNPSLWKSP